MINKPFVILLFVGLIACSNQQTEDKSPGAETNSLSQVEPALNVTFRDYVPTDSAMAQTLYVPVYSHIYQLSRQKTFNLTATQSFRNINLNRSVILTKVLYYDSEGSPVKNYLTESKTIKPSSSISFVSQGCVLESQSTIDT